MLTLQPVKSLRDRIVHALGGFTASDIEPIKDEAYNDGSLIVVYNLCAKARRLYGKPSEEWCSTMYDHIQRLKEQYESYYDKPFKKH